MQFWQRFWEELPYFLDVLIPAAGMTVLITAGAFVLAVGVGLLLALLQTAKIPVIHGAVRSYIEIIRGMPVLALLFILYIGLFEVGLPLTPVQAAILGLGMNGAAYMAEIFRAGISAIHAGQLEAALTVGMTPLAAMRWVILPQALQVVLPPLANFAIALLKDTSVASLISAPELMLRARDLASSSFEPFAVFMLAAVLYLAMSLPISFLTRRLEDRFARA
jgi:polar amino acid transport system permease protein/cystine transport system permease protein